MGNGLRTNFWFIVSPIGEIAGTISSGDTASMPYRRDVDQLPSEYTTNSCPRRCTEDYYPICATNKSGESKVFVNDCYMALENCNQSPQRGNFLVARLSIVSDARRVKRWPNVTAHLFLIPTDWFGTIVFVVRDNFAFSTFIWNHFFVRFQCFNGATARIVQTMETG